MIDVRPTRAELERRDWWTAAAVLARIGRDVVVYDPETTVHHTEWSGDQAAGLVRIVPAPGAGTWRLQVTGDGETTEHRIDDCRRRPVPTW